MGGEAEVELEVVGVELDEDVAVEELLDVEELLEVVVLLLSEVEVLLLVEAEVLLLVEVEEVEVDEQDSLMLHGSAKPTGRATAHWQARTTPVSTRIAISLLLAGTFLSVLIRAASMRPRARVGQTHRAISSS